MKRRSDRIVTYANRLGRENVIAGTDCGFGTSTNSNLIYPPVVSAKLQTLAEGARLASAQLRGRQVSVQGRHGRRMD